MATAQLSLALDPVLPSRVPRDGHSTQGFGFRLCLPDGPAIEHDDPLLHAFGAFVDWVEYEDDESLQHESFDPGRSLQVVADPFGDELCVLDVAGIRTAGTLGGQTGAVARAALEHGLSPSALALWEVRGVDDDRRCGLRVLVYEPRFITVAVGACPQHPRPARSRRPRLLLLADATGDLYWWDPAADGGPIDVHDLPFSGELADAFATLREEYTSLLGGTVDDSFDLLEIGWASEALVERTRALWQRARRELRGRFAVGYLAPGMERPQWDEAEDDRA